MKVLTILGTRPEIIRLSRIIPLLDRFCEHRLVHTGQNFDPNLSDVFFQELGVRQPDHFLGVRGASFGEQIGQIIQTSERILTAERPDRLLILGDTNSALAGIVAKRLGIPVYHMEAGNRCYDDRVPEEVNRRIIDHSSDVLLPYTERSRANLLREGIAAERIYVTGNPIGEVLTYHRAAIESADVLDRLQVQAKGYFLVTMHRAENVDDATRLRALLDGLHAVAERYQLPVICSTHPRTEQRLRELGVASLDACLRFLPPFGFFDFVRLEQAARCVISDSGTVQEECSIMRVPNVTIRDVTERPETLECGSNMLAGADAESLLRAVAVVLDDAPRWNAPPEYEVAHVSQTVVRIVLGYNHALNRAKVNN